MAVVAKRTKAIDLAFDRVAELIVADESGYPNEMVFIPADVPDFGQLLSRALLGDVAIMVIYPDGRERFIPAPSTPA
jgi:hypothetical protein